MPKGYNVKLDIKSGIAFPIECVVCEKNANGRVRTIMIGSLDRNRSYSKIKNSLSVPMHPACSVKYSFLFWKKHSLIFVVFAILAIIFFVYFDFSNETFVKNITKRLMSTLAVAAVALPLAFCNIKHPLPIECEYEKGNLDITFTSRAYAERFSQINATAVKKND